MSLMSSMNIAQQALLVNQAALNVVSNNISNVNTDGYSRQRVNLSPGVNYTPLGSSTADQAYSSCGVEISSVQRYSDAYLQSYYRQQNSTNSYLDQYSQVSTEIESLTNELQGSGLEAAFTKFYEAAQTLSLNPQDATARQNYMQQAQTIALKFNDLSSNFKDTETSFVGDINVPGTLEASKLNGMVSQANDLMNQITKVNSDIVMMGSSNNPSSSLLDKRDQLIDQLSAFVPVSVSENSNGTVNLSISGLEMIKGTQQIASLDLAVGTTSDTPAIVQLKDSTGTVISNSINKYITSGEIGAVLTFTGPASADSLTLQGVMKDYDNLASGFASIINDIQTKVTASGTPMAINSSTNQLTTATENIFESSDGTPITASNIQINTNIMTDPNLIAVARVDITDYDPNGIGNNSNMLEVLKSRSNNSSLLGNASPEGSLANLVGAIGLKNSTVETNLTNQKAVLTQAKNQLSSVTGVNIDEELMDLTKYQTAYKASARIYTVCNDLLNTLMTLGQ